MPDPGVAVVVGARRPAGRSSLLSLIAAYERAKDEFIFASPIADLYYGSANNMAVRREVFVRFGPFSECRAWIGCALRGPGDPPRRRGSIARSRALAQDRDRAVFARDSGHGTDSASAGT